MGWQAMKFTIRTQCGECEQYRRFELRGNGHYTWWECPQCGESFGLEMSTQARVTPGSSIA